MLRFDNLETPPPSAESPALNWKFPVGCRLVMAVSLSRENCISILFYGSPKPCPTSSDQALPSIGSSP